MVNWSSPDEVEKDSDVYTKLIFVFFGVYLWEIIQTCPFEWSLITGKRKFVWPLVFFFFLCRYCMLWALVGLIISLTISSPVNCQALYTFNSWSGNMAILCASTSLMIRTIALWERQLKVVIPIGILCLAHWALLWRGMFIVDATYDSTVGGCVVTSTNHVFLNLGFFMTMGFDLTILLFTMAVLTRHQARSDLWRLLFQDGLVYFIITFSCNAVPAILAILNLNSIMNVIATIPAATIASIASCRAVIRLQDFRNGDVYIHSTANVVSNPPRNAQLLLPCTAHHRIGRPEVHVTTDHIVMKDFESPSTAENENGKPDTLEIFETDYKSPHSPTVPRRTYAIDAVPFSNLKEDA